MTEFIQEHIILFWLCLGAAFLIIEAVGVTGVGFFFAGMAAITVGGLLHFDVIALDDHTQQAMLFFATTFAWAMLLWVPLKKFKQGRAGESFNNMVGDSATVASTTLKPGKMGKVIWSGTTMNAKLDADVTDELSKDSDVTITRVEGTTLIVSPAA